MAIRPVRRQTPDLKEPTVRDNRATLTVIMLNAVLMGLGWSVWTSLFNNFAVEEIGVQAAQIGLIQSVREVPGLLGILVGMLALVLVEIRIAGLSLVMLGAGVLLTSVVRDVPGLIGATLLLSVGFHFFNPSNVSALLLTQERDEAPKTMGRMNSLQAVATVVGSVAIFVALDAWGYRPLLRMAGLVVVVGGLALLPFGTQRRAAGQGGRRKVLRRRYWLYYALKFNGGSRRNIFRTFAVFLLVQQYQVSAQTVTLLYLINSVLGVYLHQAFGKIVARYGERRVLTFSYALLVPIFLGYAFVPLLQPLATPAFQTPPLGVGGLILFPAMDATPALVILLVLFVLDMVMMGFSIALDCYLQKIAETPADITPSVAMGQSVDHIAAVTMPLAGGALWAATGAQYTFAVGVVIALVSLGLTQFMRVEEQEGGVCAEGVAVPAAATWVPNQNPSQGCGD